MNMTTEHATVPLLFIIIVITIQSNNHIFFTKTNIGVKGFEYDLGEITRNGFNAIKSFLSLKALSKQNLFIHFQTNRKWNFSPTELENVTMVSKMHNYGRRPFR